WRYYETVYTERYMDTPEANPEGYAQSSTLNYLPQLQGDLLLIHGTSDDIVMWQHSILFMEAALKAGKQVDYLIYPGYQHSIKGKGRGHLLEKMTGWLEAQF
ncbi:MAG: prolyl oligopeptidase family serine peptidase, partial [Calditrichaeota bacterium]|nr:prolyl oligopeptidase family serine peptidase [Calditrichota bacterium]